MSTLVTGRGTPNLLEESRPAAGGDIAARFLEAVLAQPGGDFHATTRRGAEEHFIEEQLHRELAGDGDRRDLVPTRAPGGGRRGSWSGQPFP